MCKINVELLLKIKEQILKEPLQFQMGCFFSNHLDFDYLTEKYKVPNCGTAACIGGWAISIFYKLFPKDAWIATEGQLIKIDNEPYEIARKILNLDYRQSEELFQFSNWPVRFRFNGKNTPKERAKLTAEYIDYFISNNS